MFLVFLSVYGGLKGGEYLANKLSKPIDNNKGIFGLIGGNKAIESSTLSESDMVTITAIITEFVTAEHLKKDDKLVLMVDKAYYNSFIKNIKQLSQGAVSIQDINFKETGKDTVKIEAVFIKGNKKESEIVTMKNFSGTWKVTEVKR